MNRKILIKILCVFLPILFSAISLNPFKAFSNNENEYFISPISDEEKARTAFNKMNIQGLEFDTFLKAFKGYQKLLQEGNIKNRILSIVDFSKSSNTERLFVIDMQNLDFKYSSLVAHGKKSGEEYANAFANVLNSEMSSLGFYITAETYSGKHGFSLRLDGMEECNNEARSRAIVVHSADYVSRDFISKYGRLGRSQGCPALPVDLNNQIIDLIKEGSCLFIYHPSEDYIQNSKLIK